MPAPSLAARVTLSLSVSLGAALLFSLLTSVGHADGAKTNAGPQQVIEPPLVQSAPPSTPTIPELSDPPAPPPPPPAPPEPDLNQVVPVDVFGGY